MMITSLPYYHRAAIGPLTLEHYGKPMRADPQNMPIGYVVSSLLDGHSVYVDLQPGDGTRYELLLQPLDAFLYDQTGTVGVPSWEPGYLLVTRLIGGQPVASVIIGAVPDESLGMSELMPLSHGNAWTLDLLTWWLACVWQTLAERGRGGL